MHVRVTVWAISVLNFKAYLYGYFFENLMITLNESQWDIRFLKLIVFESKYVWKKEKQTNNETSKLIK